MSWSSYIDNLIGHSKDDTGTAHCDRASLIGLDGVPWSSSEKDLKMTGDEVRKIASICASNNDQEFQSYGVTAEGVKYNFLRNDDKSFEFKMKDNGHLTIGKAKTAIVIGHTKEGSQPGNVRKAVGIIVEFLKDRGF